MNLDPPEWSQQRQYNYSLGRWLAPDPANTGADSMNPQSWNACSYAGNNPITNIAPSGEDDAGEVCRHDGDGGPETCT